MHQTKKGNEWYFDIKVHIGVDKDSSLIYSIVTTAANVHDLTPSRSHHPSGSASRSSTPSQPEKH